MVSSLSRSPLTLLWFTHIFQLLFEDSKLRFKSNYVFVLSLKFNYSLIYLYIHIFFFTT